VTDEALNKIASLTEGFSGAELENLINLAALSSVRKAVSSKSKASKLSS
jgi:ATP-dependent Zn protease